VHGHLELRTTFTDGTASRTESIRYLVVNASYAYNMLLGRATLNRLGAVPLTRHMKMKLPDLAGKVITIKSDQKEAKRCYENSLKTKRGVFMVTTRPPYTKEVPKPEVSCTETAWTKAEIALGDGDQEEEEKEVEVEDAHRNISSSSFLPQRITRCKFKELGSSVQMFSLFVVSF